MLSQTCYDLFNEDFRRNGLYESEVAGATFSDFDSAPVPKFLNPGPDPGPTIFQS